MSSGYSPASKNALDTGVKVISMSSAERLTDGIFRSVFHGWLNPENCETRLPSSHACAGAHASL